jgi:hypothetical protein
MEKHLEEDSLKPLDSPTLNACQEFGKYAARLHARRFWRWLDSTNRTFDLDGLYLTKAQVLHNLAVFYIGQDQYARAVPLLERACSVCEKAVSHDHALTTATLTSLVKVFAQ